MRITNPGENDVRVRDFRSSCICTAIEPQSLTVPGHGSRDVQLTLDLTHGSAPAQHGNRAFQVSVAAVIGEDDSSRSEWWTVRGKVRRVIGQTNMRVDFGSVSELAQPLSPRKQSVHAETPLDRIEVRGPAGGRFRVVVQPADETGTRFDVAIEPTGQIPVGPFTEKIALVPVGRDGRVLPTRHIDVRGEILADIQASPPMLSFGVRYVGEVAEDTFTIASLTGRPFRVVRVVAEGRGLTAHAGLEVAATASFVFTTKARVEQVGQTKGAVRMTVVDSQGRERTIIVPALVQGLTPLTRP